MERISKVILEANGVKESFEISHAERILRMPDNGGWQLPENSPFKLTEDGITVRANSRDSKKPKENQSDKPSDTPPTEA
jgi:hypothetical protein